MTAVWSWDNKPKKKYGYVKPSRQDFENYEGKGLWKETPHDWRCPACGLNKFQLLRWKNKDHNGLQDYWGWYGGLVYHHDHSTESWGYKDKFDDEFSRFKTQAVCTQCNYVDSSFKKKFGSDYPFSLDTFSFSPSEIKSFTTACCHNYNQYNWDKAKIILAEHIRVWQNEIVDRLIDQLTEGRKKIRLFHVPDYAIGKFLHFLREDRKLKYEWDKFAEGEAEQDCDKYWISYLIVPPYPDEVNTDFLNDLPPDLGE